MSKGNLFLGYARGKVGDVVFSRNNGEQITRARNRHPANPRSNAQLAQRAIMATIGKAYSAGSFIFNHSFQGKKVGGENQQEFMSLNAKLYRQLLADELLSPPVRYDGVALVPPSATYPVGGPFIISRGSLEQDFFRFGYVEPTAGVTNRLLNVSWPAPILTTGEEGSDETVGEYMQRVGLVIGDMYTFVFFASDQATETLEPATVFGFVRMKVRSDVDVERSADDCDLSIVFEYLESSFVDSSSNIFSGTLGAAVAGQSLSSMPLRSFIFPQNTDYGLDCVGCIRSRESSGLRSNSEMLWATSENHPRLSSLQYIEAWQQIGQSIVDPVLLLEGGEKEGVSYE